MAISATVPDLPKLYTGLEADLAHAMTGAMTAATAGLKEDLRDQTRSVGLGNKLANAWRGKTYPEAIDSLDPSSYVFSRAAKIIDAFSRDVVIVPRAGRCLAIPTDNVPTTTGGRHIGPREVERRIGKPLFLKKGRGNHLLAFADLNPTRSSGGFRIPKGRRAYGPQKAQGRGKLVLMFTYVPDVKTRPRLDLEATANRWAAEVPNLLADRVR